MKESDWKVFKEIKSKALDKFCAAVLDECVEQIDLENATNHEKYLSIYKLIDDRNYEISRLFDFHSRSKAVLQLLAIREEGLADEKLVETLSEEFQKRTDPKKYE